MDMISPNIQKSSQAEDATIIDKWKKMMEAYKPTHKPMATLATVPRKDPIMFNTTTPTRTQHEPTYEITSPNPPSTPSPKYFNH